MAGTIYWKRLNLCAEIIRNNGEVTRLQLARKLTSFGMPCTPWTIDKIKPDILELFEDIIYDKYQRIFLTKELPLPTVSSTIPSTVLPTIPQKEIKLLE